MNIFGIGTMELVVILLVAFIALGPGKTMETARTIGRMVREARRAFGDIMEAASFDDDGGGKGDGAGAGRHQGRTTAPPGDPLPGPAHLAEQATAAGSTSAATGDGDGGGGDTAASDTAAIPDTTASDKAGADAAASDRGGADDDGGPGGKGGRAGVG